MHWISGSYSGGACIYHPMQKYVAWQTQVSLSHRIRRTVEQQGSIRRPTQHPIRPGWFSTFTAIHKFNSWTSAGRCSVSEVASTPVDWLPIRHRLYQWTWARALVAFGARGGRQRFAGGARACWPCRFQGAVRGRTSDYRLPSEPAPALWPVARRSSHSARVFYSSTWAPRLSRWPLLLGVIRLAANARGPRGSGQQWCGACPPAVS